MKRLLVDPHYLIAIALGPLVWVALYLWLGTSSAAFDPKLLIIVCLVYPVLEELSFRGFIQSWLLDFPMFAKNIVGKLSAANIVTSIVFAAAHLFGQPPLWAASVFFPSLVFGYFRDRTQRVLPGILLHCWYNAGFFLILK